VRASRRERFGIWLQRFTWTHRWLFVFDGEHNGRRRYVNRINGHLVMKP
jgi:hypothetical protein